MSTSASAEHFLALFITHSQGPLDATDMYSTVREWRTSRLLCSVCRYPRVLIVGTPFISLALCIASYKEQGIRVEDCVELRRRSISPAKVVSQ